MRVLLSTEGTYPYVKGGVSTWAQSLMSGLPRHDFTVVSIVANPMSKPLYPVPPNVSVVMVPLWGSELVEEYIPLPGAAHRDHRTTQAVIGSRFLPVLESLLDELLVAVSDPATVAEGLVALAEFSASYNLRRALQDKRAWDLVLQHFTANPLYLHTSMRDAVDLARSLFRYFLPLTLPLPDVDIAHATAASFCIFPTLVLKLRNGTPFILSEHGVYLRERILDLVRHRAHMLGKTMFGNLCRGLGHVAYRYADVVVPVCAYNTRWEFELGVKREQVRILYNGVDPDRFAPVAHRPERPTVAYVGRIDPLKDILTLIRAAERVRREIPDVVFHLYGPDSVPEYAERCREAVRALGLEDVVLFEGPTDDVAAAYRDCDVAVLSSMSEGFPFAVVEAMMCGRPIVATAVGGVAEALGDPSLLAEPQNAPSLAVALVHQLRRTGSERELTGRHLRERALELFSLDRFLGEYDRLYHELSARPDTSAPSVEAG